MRTTTGHANWLVVLTLEVNADNSSSAMFHHKRRSSKVDSFNKGYAAGYAAAREEAKKVVEVQLDSLPVGVTCYVSLIIDAISALAATEETR